MSNIGIERERFALFFKALSNPHRLALFEQLTNCCSPGTHCSIEEATRSVGQLGQELDIAPSTLSHHLKELNRAGLIEMERKGKQVMCWVEPSVLTSLSNYFARAL